MADRTSPAVGPPTTESSELLRLLLQAKRLAKRYYTLTGRPLGVTGEVAEYEAITILRLTPAPVRTAGFDATRIIGARKTERLQIKGRCVVDPSRNGQRLGKIDRSKPCDAVLLVLLDSDYNAYEIHRAEWSAVFEALVRPGSKARTERGQLSVSCFRRIGHPLWARERHA